MAIGSWLRRGCASGIALLAGACVPEAMHPTHPVWFGSDPPGATCEVRLTKHTVEGDKLYGTVVTPGILTLPQRTHLVATCRKEGYRDAVAPLSRAIELPPAAQLAGVALLGLGNMANKHTLETSINVTLAKQ